MAEAFNLLRRVKSLDIAPELSGYSGVVIFAGQDDDGNNIEYRAGDQTGTVLEITNEWGSQAQADAIYQKIKGFKYQPYTASGTRIDPSVEIGDAVTVSDIYGGVFSKAVTFGRHITTDLEAPSKEEVEHEFQIQSPTNRQYERFTRTVRASLSITSSKIAAEVEDRQEADNLLRATLNIHAQEIAAKVSSEVGNTSSNFWWKLLSTGWDVGTGSKTVFSVKAGGAYVDGEIRATSGKIGGLDIKFNYLSYNNQTWGGTNSNGIYMGPSGIQCGPASSGVQLTPNGYLYAENGYFRGSVNAGNIQSGGSYGYMNGSALSDYSVSGGKVAGSTLSTRVMTSGINTSLGYADRFNSAANGDAVKNWYTSYLYTAYLYVNGSRYKPTWIYYTDSGGKSAQMRVLAYAS